MTSYFLLEITILSLPFKSFFEYMKISASGMDAGWFGDKAIIEKESNKKNDTENKINKMKSSNRKHSIEVTDYKEIINKCPKSAKAGDKVTIKTNIFMDAIPKINVNGSDIGEWDKNRTEYTFVMPDEDVEIITTLKSAGES